MFLYQKFLVNSSDYIENIVNDDELFFEEITQQIEKKLLRQKSRKLNRNDLIKSKIFIFI